MATYEYTVNQCRKKLSILSDNETEVTGMKMSDDASVYKKMTILLAKVIIRSTSMSKYKLYEREKFILLYYIFIIILLYSSTKCLWRFGD